MNFDVFYRILTNEFGLESKHTKNGDYERYSYFFKDRFIGHKRSQVFLEVCALKNGGIGGYIYVDHLREYDNHTRDLRFDFG